MNGINPNTGYGFWKRFRPDPKAPADALSNTPLGSILQSPSATVTMFRPRKPALRDSAADKRVIAAPVVDFNEHILGGWMIGDWMKRFVWILAVPVLLSSLSFCQAESSASATASSDSKSSDSGQPERMFFPRDTLWGWAQFDLAPPHNEIDPNICAGNAGQYGGVNAPCSMFARYMLSGMLEVRPFGRGQLRRFMVFGAPTFLFGKTIPQTLYTWSPDAIGIEHSWGVGIYIDKGFEFRVTQHFLFDRLGARDTYLGIADLGNNGPWGRYMTVGVRKYFGTRRW